MPAIILNCPQCERALRVTEDLIGRLVKCPACGLTFSVPAGTDESRLGAPSPGIPGRPTPSRRPAPEDYVSTEDDFEEAPARRRHLDAGAIEEDEHDRARSLVTPPAKLLLLSGILGLLVDVWQTVYAAVKTHVPAPALAGPPRNFLEGFQQGVEQGVTGPLPIILGAVFAVVSILVILAAVQMLRLRTYLFAKAGTVLAMVNFVNCCCLLGLPAGIWALVILSKPEVKSAFSEISSNGGVPVS